MLTPINVANDLQHIIESVGFSAREAHLYLIGLQVGNAPASEYAKKASLNRITTYNALEDMVHRGYFTVTRRMRSKWYSPVSPEYLGVEARKNAQSLERVLPELKALQGAKFCKPRVRFCEGFEGIRRVYEDTLTAHSELLNYANSRVVRSHWPAYDDEYVAQRVKAGVRLRGIAPDDEVGRRVQGQDEESLREIRLVSDKEFDFTNEIKIYDHKVAIVSFGDGEEDMFGVIIESKVVAETQRQIFEMAWRYAGNITQLKQAEQKAAAQVMARTAVPSIA